MQIKSNEELILLSKLNHKKYYKWLRHVVALANSQGGIINFGISKKGQIRNITKINDEIDFIKQKILENINPTINFIINKCAKENDKEIIELAVLKSQKIVYLKNKNQELVLYLRKKGETVPATYSDIEMSYKESIPSTNSLKTSTSKYKEAILSFCEIPRSRQEIQEHIGVASRPYFRENILLPLLQTGLLVSTNKNLRASNQKYQTKK